MNFTLLKSSQPLDILRVSSREDELLKEAVKDHLMDPAAKLVEAQNNNNNARIIS